MESITRRRQGANRARRERQRVACIRPVAFSSAWRTDTAVAIAAQKYELRDFSATPILADALRDAGCEDAAVLAHCRRPGPHARGGWVVDALLTSPSQRGRPSPGQRLQPEGCEPQTTRGRCGCRLGPVDACRPRSSAYLWIAA